MNAKLIKLTISLAYSLIICHYAQAGTIHWGNALGDSFYSSTGSQISTTDLSSQFKFELGVFEAGFTPNGTNVNLWTSKWKKLDSASYGVGSFAGSVTLGSGGILDGDTSEPVSIFAGQQAYIWVYNGLSLTPGSEWSLVSNTNWILSDSSGQVASTQSLFLSNPGTTATFGQEQGDGTLSTGAGYASNPLNSGFQIQTYSFIPEPSTMALLFSGMGLLWRRRRPSV